MPTLDFKGKQFIYGHHLTVPVRTLNIDTDKSLTKTAKTIPHSTITSSSTAITYMP